MHALAARAGVEDLAPFSLRELDWRRKALEMDQWDRVAVLCCAMPALAKRRFEDFHPLRRAAKRVNLGDLQAWVEAAGKTLPPTLPETQIQIAWRQYLQQQARSPM